MSPADVLREWHALYLGELPETARQRLADAVPGLRLDVLPPGCWATPPVVAEPRPVEPRPVEPAAMSGPPRTPGDPCGLAARAEIAIGGLVPRGFLEAAPRLGWWVVPFAGIPAATRESLRGRPGLTVVNSHFNAGYTAEHAFALLLALMKRIIPGHEGLRRGDWRMRYEEAGSAALRGTRLLLIGYGAIGRAIVPFARGFDMRVSAIRRTPAAAPELDAVGTRAELPAFLAEADAIIVALPATQETDGFLGEAEFAAMRPGAFLVNVGRGPAIDEAALHAALSCGRLGGAAIDTWWAYPADAAARSCTPPSRLGFADFPNFVFSPHRASHVQERDHERLADLARLLRAIVAGTPLNVVDLEAGY